MKNSNKRNDDNSALNDSEASFISDETQNQNHQSNYRGNQQTVDKSRPNQGYNVNQRKPSMGSQDQQSDYTEEDERSQVSRTNKKVRRAPKKDLSRQLSQNQSEISVNDSASQQGNKRSGKGDESEYSREMRQDDDNVSKYSSQVRVKFNGKHKNQLHTLDQDSDVSSGISTAKKNMEEAKKRGEDVEEDEEEDLDPKEKDYLDRIRKRNRRFVKQQRNEEALRLGAGGWLQERHEFRTKHFTNAVIPTLKTILIAGLCDLVYVTWMLSVEPVACKDFIETNITTDIRGQYFFYWWTSYVHWTLLLVMFVSFSKPSILMALGAGILQWKILNQGSFSIMWHILNIILFFATPSKDQSGSPLWKALLIFRLYWLELVFAFILLNATISLQFRKKVDSKGRNVDDLGAENQSEVDDDNLSVNSEYLRSLNLKNYGNKKKKDPMRGAETDSNVSRGTVNSLPRSTRSGKNRKNKLQAAPETIKEEDDGSQITDFEGSDISNPNNAKKGVPDRGAVPGTIEYGSYVGGYKSPEYEALDTRKLNNAFVPAPFGANNSGNVRVNNREK